MNNQTDVVPAQPIVPVRRRRTQRTITITEGPRDELLRLVNYHPRSQHPGSAVRLVLEYLDLPISPYYHVVHELVGLSATTAVRLEIDTGIPGRQWMMLQSEYELWHARIALKELYAKP